jgi:hypothetical protein
MKNRFSAGVYKGAEFHALDQLFVIPLEHSEIRVFRAAKYQFYTSAASSSEVSIYQ